MQRLLVHLGPQILVEIGHFIQGELVIGFFNMQLNELAELIFNYVLYGLVEGDIRELLLYEIVIELGLEHELVLLFLTKRVYVLFKHIIVNLQDLLDFVYIGVG